MVDNSDERASTGVPPAGRSALMHIAINAIDLDKTLAFYGKAFGYTKTYSWSRAQVVDDGQVLFEGSGTYLDVGGATFIELFPMGEDGQSMDSGTVAHFSLVVNDIDEAYRLALEHGGTAKGLENPSAWDGTPRTIELNGDPALRERVAYIEGPNGEAIELYELLTPIPTK